MRRLSAALFVLVLLAVTLAAAAESVAGSKGSSGGQVHVDGYVRKDGTYVQPHVRSVPDGNPYNNYGFPGNYNPNTGRTTGGDPDKYLERYYDRSHRSLWPRTGTDD